MLSHNARGDNYWSGSLTIINNYVTNVRSQMRKHTLKSINFQNLLLYMHFSVRLMCVRMYILSAYPLNGLSIHYSYNFPLHQRKELLLQNTRINIWLGGFNHCEDKIHLYFFSFIENLLKQAILLLKYEFNYLSTIKTPVNLFMREFPL